MKKAGIVVLVALLLQAAAVFAADTDAKAPVAEPAPAPEPGPYTALSNSVTSYQNEIARIEQEGGALDGRLSEPLTSVGVMHLATGDYAAAAQAFERALFVMRVNEGLYSLSQVPLIELQIENNTAWDQTEELDRNYQHLYWVFRRNHGPEDMALVPFIEKIAARRLRTFNIAPNAAYLSHVVHADNLYDNAIDILDKHPEERAAMINALYHRALANYNMASVVDDTSQSMADLRKAMAEGSRGPYDIEDLYARSEMFRDTYFKGTVALDRLVELTAEDPRDYFAHAEALAFAGDYCFSSRRDWDAMAYYEDAWNVLRENNATPEEVLGLFGTPKRVEPIAIPGEIPPEPNERRRWVDATFDVSDNGWPENIRIIATHPENDEALITRGRLAVAGVRHRPRFENGAPVASSNVSLRYVFRRY